MWPFLRRLRLPLCCPAAAAPAAVPPAAPTSPMASPAPRPPRLSRPELELSLLLAFLPDAERPRFLARLVQAAPRRFPWQEHEVAGEPRAQCAHWEPLAGLDKLTVPGLCARFERELEAGLRSYQTPLEELSRPVRMYWLLKQGRRLGQVAAALEQRLGSRQQALRVLWWVVADL